MSNFIVGLTGGIGSGKTTVSDLFSQHFNIDVVDADVIARQVVQPGTPALSAITEKFGHAVLTKEGHLDRAQLRAQVFSNTEHKNWLNGLLHPLIRAEMQSQCLAAKSAYVILSIPLLVENQLQSLANRVLVVDCPEEIQLQRASQRDGVGEAQIKSIMQAQAGRKERLAVADDVLVNDSDTGQLLTQIARLHSQYLTLAATHNATAPKQ